MPVQQQEGLGMKLKEYKKALHRLSSELINNKISNKLYYLLIIIETLQILAYQCHEAINYEGWGVAQFRILTHFINPEYYLKHSNLIQIIIPISTFIVLSHAGILGFCFKKQRQKVLPQEDKNQEQNHKESLLYTIGHWYTIVYMTTLTTPMFLPSLMVFYCNAQNPYFQSIQCYSTYHIFLIILAFINILWTLAINIYGSLLYFTFNPIMWENVLSLSSPLFNVLKLLIKIVPAAYLIFDPTLKYSYLFVVGIAILVVGYTGISRIVYPYTRYNQTDDKVILYIEVISIFISTFFIMEVFLDSDSGFILTFLVAIIAPFPIASAGYQLMINSKEELILKINQLDKENTQDIEKLLCYLIANLENNSIPAKDKRFLKVIKIHNDECQFISCPCHQYLNKVESHSLDHHTSKQLIYKVFIQIIDQMLQQNKKAYSLIILKAYIEFYQLQSTFKAAYIASKILNQKISFFQEYLIHAFLYEVTKTYRDPTNVETYRVFSENSIMFEKEIITLAQNYAEFWQQLCEQNSSLKKIMNLLRSTQKSKELIHSLFQTLHNIYPTNIHIVDIYKELFKHVLLEYEQYVKYSSLYEDNIETKEEIKLMRADRNIKFSPNQDLIVLNTSVNITRDIFHGGCEIVSVSNNVHKVLGYSSNDLIGKNINRFLPKLYAQFHDDIIKNYLNRENSQHKTRDIVIFPLNSNGNVVECSMVVKIMPSLQHGINIISFLLNSNKSHQNLIIYDHRTGLIDSMSERAQNLLLGKRSSKKSSLDIPDHINDILPAWDHLNEKMWNSSQTIANSRQIQVDYSFIHLYQSDGPQDNKYVKVINFKLQFESKMFSMKTLQNANLWMSFQTVGMNAPNNANSFKDDFTIKPGAKREKQDDLVASGNLLVTQLVSTLILENKNQGTVMYKSLGQSYSKVYLGFQGLCVIALLVLIIYNYVATLNYYSTLQNDFIIKENIVDAGNLVIQSAHQASQYIFSGENSIIQKQVNVTNAVNHLNELQSIGQFVYQQIVYKQQLGQISISDLMLNVTYFSSQGSQSNASILQTIKQKTVTDSSYQLVLYLIEVYNNSDPVNNLMNNILFVFKNCLNITDQFTHLNQIFTANLLQNTTNRKSLIFTLFGCIMGVFFLSIVWELIYKLVIISKVNDVMSVYDCIPTSELSRFPEKCEKFIKYVCPIDKDEVYEERIRKISILNPPQGPNQKLEDNDQQNINLNNPKVNLKNPYELIQQDELIEYITFSSRLSAKSVIFQAFLFLALFSVLFIVNLLWENSVIEENIGEMADWNMISEYKSSVISIVFAMNQVENLGSQWGGNDLIRFRARFEKEINDIQGLIKETSTLNPYLSSTFQLLQQSILILNSPNITATQFIVNEQKLTLLSQTVTNQQIHAIIEPNISSTITDFTTLLQLIFIAQIIIFLLYALLYLPKSFVKHREQNHLAQLMYDTLGRKLQNMAFARFKTK